jgi:hypothetical protein
MKPPKKKRTTSAEPVEPVDLGRWAEEGARERRRGKSLNEPPEPEFKVENV